MEGIWSGEEFPEDLPADLVIGYHLAFYPDWLDFYRDDRRALKRKFGSLDAAARFYGGPGPETLLEQYRADLRRAAGLNPHYVVCLLYTSEKWVGCTDTRHVHPMGERAFTC